MSEEGDYSESLPLRQPRHFQHDTDELTATGSLNDYSDQKENLSVWIQKPEVIAFIRKKFGNFLRTFVDESE